MDYILAFVIGGIICVLSQILMDTTKLMPGRVMVILVCTGVIRASWYLRTFHEICRSGCFRSPDRIRLQPVERNQGCSKRRWLSRTVPRWFQNGSRRNLRRFDLLLLCISHLLSKDAKELKLYL